MFENFKKAVLNSYDEKKEKKQLSENLEHPTQAKLRKECLSILEKRYCKKDDQTICAFFDPDHKFDNHELRIQKFELDGFKSLLQFFLKGHGIRKEENIKLLAWLIDFEPRPYNYTETYTENGKLETNSDSEEPIDQNINYPPPQTTVPLPWKKISIISFSILIVLFGISIYSSTDVKPKQQLTKNIPSDNEQPNTSATIKKEEGKKSENKSVNINDMQCMYWADDHYVPIFCNKEIGNTTKIALDTKKIAHFKKINKPDTLTKNSLGKTWYVKINGLLEYYTSEGFHPIHTDKKLKRLTEYMLNKYVLRKPKNH